jgi:superfamily II DNA or RNA helicase/HKD family nuclease
MRLREFTFRHEYRSGSDDLIRDLYHPALLRCSDYWRAVGFFSSTAFEAIGAPLGDMVGHGGKMRLITSVCLEEADVVAISQGHDRKKVCEARLLTQIREEFNRPLGRGSFLLAMLLEAGRLEMRIALPETGRGIYHEKVGVFLGEGDEFVAFSGSSNESRSGLEVNYECVDVYTSWDDAVRATRKRKHYETLWSGTAPGVVVIPFPQAVEKELIRIHKLAGDSQAAELVRSPGNLWPHQVEAFDEFLNKERGVLEMATGTGKTRTALRICHELYERNLTVIVATDGNDLLDQWYGQLLDLTKQVRQKLVAFRHYRDHHERDKFALHPKHSILLVSRPALGPALRDLSRSEAGRTILIHDEVHRLGSPGNRKELAGRSDHVRFRLGLSATPDREYDQEGNAFIEHHVGSVLYRFELSDAIKRGILSPFDYHPIEYVPTAEDRAALKQVYKRQAARKASGQPMSMEEVWIELARVYKTSRAKLPLFDRFIEQRRDLLKRCIIFVETREYGEEVLDIVHKYRHDFHTYYAEEDASTLRRFAEGDIECLITCHRLSEGIDIRSLETVILFSSARARLETIQRMGRCLRINPLDPRKRANVIDFIRVAGDEDEAIQDNNADEERCAWLTELADINPEGPPDER